MNRLDGKVVFITGASRGIGEAAAYEFARAGAFVLLAARDLVKTNEIAQKINAEGGAAHAVPCDVMNYAQVEAAVDECVQLWDGLDVLVNNAGVIDPVSRLAESDPVAWGRALDVNVKGVYHGLRATLPIMQRKGEGIIINISSGAATGALEGWSHYCSSKAAVLSLTKCVHKEYAEQGIRCVGLSPGTVATDMQVVIKESGMNPVSELDPSVHIPADWVGQAIVWLTSPAARAFDGGDFSLKTDEGRALVGLPAINA